uniref:Uncharacterized protein n=1 Tax=Anguilla anguilla TaxID=7936 RepID=A0A0E9TCP5_ANGAN
MEVKVHRFQKYVFFIY